MMFSESNTDIATVLVYLVCRLSSVVLVKFYNYLGRPPVDLFLKQGLIFI